MISGRTVTCFAVVSSATIKMSNCSAAPSLLLAKASEVRTAGCGPIPALEAVPPQPVQRLFDMPQTGQKGNYVRTMTNFVSQQGSVVITEVGLNAISVSSC